jgi:hypothetical protein
MGTVRTAPRDRWDKIEILLKPVGGLLTGIALALVGYFTTNVLEKQQAAETSQRLYAEIMSSREKADSDLRKEMFNAIIGAFLNPGKDNLSDKVLALELLAYNFHDVIDLSPLFKHVARAIDDSTDNKRGELNSQLVRVASEVIDKQLAALSDAGVLEHMGVDFAEIDESEELPVTEYEVPMGARTAADDAGPMRYIRITALHRYPETREIKVHLESGPKMRDDVAEIPEVDIIFNVGFFDFPMIDNTRLPHSQRVAVALTRWREGDGAQLALVYFPGSRASLKEKPYYDEVIEQLQRAQKRL